LLHEMQVLHRKTAALQYGQQLVTAVAQGLQPLGLGGSDD
jgi:hypothetical protein